MPWVTFTADHVRARLAARELEVYQDTATEDAGDTPEQRLESIVSQVCDQFRGAIRMNPLVTYPDEEAFDVVQLTVNAPGNLK